VNTTQKDKNDQDVCRCTLDPPSSSCSDFANNSHLCICADFGMEGHTPG
jgi:hypothetical protein